jgi:eukaryotic-like serine/threonine-protein kinase
MNLQPGARLGPYELISPLGAGGMGEVYRARDTRLDRTVAVKILPEALAADPTFRERFDREARAVAALNHPHICTLYDVGEQSGIAFLVMELVEGETLTARLERGALPPADALKIAIEIASALDKAHRAGIVHRDLKPGNIMLTKAGAKLLDFGLAKSTTPVGSGAGLSMLPTTPANLTVQGTILGTFQYMAPEQLDGQEADARTDIFAFGAVVYEMLTGRKAFEGKSQASLIGAIMHARPTPMSQLQPLTPPGLDQLITTCLAKDPDERWQTAADVARQLKNIAGTGSESQTASQAGAAPAVAGRTSRASLAWIVAGASIIALIGALALGIGGYLNRTPTDTHIYRTLILPPNGTEFSAGASSGTRFALSPDGRRLVFVVQGADFRGRLWVRPMDTLVAQPLAGTEGATAPFWSSDSRFVAFTASGKLKKIDVSGGPALTLADAVGIPLTGAWNRDDVILFAPKRGPLFRIPASGGTPSPVTVLDSGKSEYAHAYPFFLPDGRHFLYLSVANIGGAPASAVWVGSLDAKDKPRLLAEGPTNIEYADGHVLFVRDRTLMAQPFDSVRMELHGEAVPLAEPIETAGALVPVGAFSVSESGVLAYKTGARDIRSQLFWYDRTGKQLAAVGEPTDQMNLELSPDETRAVVSILDAARSTRDLWIYDVARGLRTRFTFDAADEMSAVWAPDGSRVVFNSRRQGNLDLYLQASSGAGTEEPLLADGRNNLYPSDWSPDGRHLLYFTGNANSPTGNDVWSLPMSGDRKPAPILRSEFSETFGRFSTDGRWVAYVSNESGRNEVYVASFGGAGGKWQVSTAGGMFPRWRRDGKEIFFLSPENRLMSAAVNGQESAFAVGVVQPLFDVRPRLEGFAGSNAWSYAVSANGQRFLVNTLVEQAVSPPIALVVNWTAGLPK